MTMMTIILLLMMKIDHYQNHRIVEVKMLRKQKKVLNMKFHFARNFIENRNMDEARAIFGEDFNFDGIDFNELNDEMDEGDLEDDDEIEEDEDEELEDEVVEPKYDEDGNLIEVVRKKIFQEDLKRLFCVFVCDHLGTNS